MTTNKGAIYINDLDYKNIVSNMNSDQSKRLIQNVVMTFQEIWEELYEKIKKTFNELGKLFQEIREITPVERYKLVKKIEPKLTPIFFNRKHVVHCRNNC